MAKAEEPVEGSALEEFLQSARSELERVQAQLKEISLLVEQSQGEVDKLTQRNATITSRLHQLQTHFDTVPREDIRSTYDAAQDAQQRLFTMRGQLEKLESDRTNLRLLTEFIAKTVRFLEEGPDLDIVSDGRKSGKTGIEQIIEAQEDERSKISRQIHDGPAQALSNFILQVEIAMRLFDVDQEKARKELEDLKQAASDTFSRVREFIFDLRPMMLDDLGLVPTARRYVEAFKEKSGLDVNVVITGAERRIEPHKEVLIFRAIQDLLGDIREHAQATQVKLQLDMSDDNVRVVLEDNGAGFDPQVLEDDQSDGRGLVLLKERVGQVGGEFEIRSQPGEGTSVSITIPTEA